MADCSLRLLTACMATVDSAGRAMTGHPELCSEYSGIQPNLPLSASHGETGRQDLPVKVKFPLVTITR
jgi:hypothetical protein